MNRKQLLSEVAERMGPYYVHILIDPRDDETFYVWKGTGQRLSAHGIDAESLSGGIEHEKLRRIRESRGTGHEPVVDVVRQGVDEANSFSCRSGPHRLPTEPYEQSARHAERSRPDKAGRTSR